MKDSKQILEYVIKMRNEINRKRRIRRNIIISVSASAACIGLAVFSVKNLIPDVKHPKAPVAQVTLSENITTTVPAETYFSEYTKSVTNVHSSTTKPKAQNTEPLTTSLKTGFESEKSDSKKIGFTTHVSENKSEKEVHTTVSGNEMTGTAGVRAASNPSKTDNQGTGEMYIEPTWNERDIYEQFISFDYKDNLYVTQCSRISDTLISEKLDEIKIYGQEYETLNIHETEVTLFSIKNISVSCAVAVQFNDNKNYYSYTSSSYFPKTFGNMLDDTDFENNAVFKELCMNKNNAIAKSYDFELLMKILKEHRNAECISDDIDLFDKYSISISIPNIGISNKAFGLTEDGYITTNIFDYQLAFYIGKESLDRFFESIVICDTEPLNYDFIQGEEE